MSRPNEQESIPNEKATKKTYFALGLILLLGALLFNYVSLTIDWRAFQSPDETEVVFFSNQLADSGKITWTSELNNRYKTDLFKPRLIKQVSQNTYSTRKITQVYILALSEKLGSIRIIPTLIALAGVVFVYILVAAEFGIWAGLVAALLATLLPSYILLANSYFDNLLSVVFFLGSLAAMVSGSRSQHRKTLLFILSGLSFALSLSIRIPDAIMALPLAVGALYLLNRKQLSIRSILIIGISGASGLGTYLFLAGRLYGGGANIAPLGSNINQSSSDIVSSFLPMPGQLLNYLPNYGGAFVNYVMGYSALLLVMGILGALIAFRWKRGLLIYVVLIGCATVFVILGWHGGTFSFEEFRVYGSMARYFTFIYISLAMLAAVVINAVRKRMGQTSALFLLIAIVINLIGVGFAPIAQSNWGYRRNSEEISKVNQLVKLLPSDAVVVTKRYDKAVFPDRQVLVYMTQKDIEAEIGKKVGFYVATGEFEAVYKASNIEKDVIPIILKMLEDKVPVYVTTDVLEVVPELQKKGWQIESEKDSIGEPRIFLRVEKMAF